MEEVWKSLKDIVECGDNYEVSTYGNVRNIIKGNLLKGRRAKKGYLTVALFLNGKRNDYQIHRLVALAFIPNPENKPQVNHIKGKEKDNNRVDNLEWATNQENQQHAFATGLHKSRKGEDNNLTKLNEDDVIEIKKALIQDVSQYELAARFGITRSAIVGIQNGKSWGHVQVDGFSPFIKDTKGENNVKSKLNEKMVLEIRKLYGTGEYSQRTLAILYDVTKTSIANIVKRKTWKHVG